MANFQSEVKKFRLLIESVKENLADDISINIFAIDILGFQSRIIKTSQLLKKVFYIVAYYTYCSLMFLKISTFFNVNFFQICVDCVHRISVEQMTVIKDKLDSALARIKQVPLLGYIHPLYISHDGNFNQCNTCLHDSNFFFKKRFLRPLMNWLIYVM